MRFSEKRRVSEIIHATDGGANYRANCAFATRRRELFFQRGKFFARQFRNFL